MGHFTQFREMHLKPGQNFFGKPAAERIYGAIDGFESNERVKHALLAWQDVKFHYLAGLYAERKLDRFDDESGIVSLLETNRKNLIDDRLEGRS